MDGTTTIHIIFAQTPRLWYVHFIVVKKKYRQYDSFSAKESYSKIHMDWR